MKGFPTMPLNLVDYDRDTGGLTTIEHGVYFLLIKSYWMQCGPLPDDNKELSGLSGLTRPQWTSMRPRIQKFFSIENGLWRHKRIDIELAKVQERVNAARRAGIKSGAKRTQPSFNGRSTGVEQSGATLVQRNPQPSFNHLRKEVSKGREEAYREEENLAKKGTLKLEPEAEPFGGTVVSFGGSTLR